MMAAGPAANPPEPKPPTTCDCKPCRHLEATRRIVYAEINAKVCDQSTVDLWNKVLADHRCDNPDF